MWTPRGLPGGRERCPQEWVFCRFQFGGCGANLGARYRYRGSRVEWLREFREGGRSRRTGKTPYSGDQVKQGLARKTLAPRTADPRAPRGSWELWDSVSSADPRELQVWVTHRLPGRPTPNHKRPSGPENQPGSTRACAHGFSLSPPSRPAPCGPATEPLGLHRLAPRLLWYDWPMGARRAPWHVRLRPAPRSASRPSSRARSAQGGGARAGRGVGRGAGVAAR